MGGHQYRFRWRLAAERDGQDEHSRVAALAHHRPRAQRARAGRHQRCPALDAVHEKAARKGRRVKKITVEDVAITDGVRMLFVQRPCALFPSGFRFQSGGDPVLPARPRKRQSTIDRAVQKALR
nr:MAG TPA: hypothetical protein [Caudoviricetes sp.]DAT76771.1 MAG TPA: hypothetical protein [Caudoviricetes sp.]DAX66305.1 MAG TPA: hypothetical protein [Caudoviricetes sp.]